MKINRFSFEKEKKRKGEKEVWPEACLAVEMHRSLFVSKQSFRKKEKKRKMENGTVRDHKERK